MANPLFYTPSGTIEVIPNNLWTVDIKQPFPIEGPFYDLAEFQLKPTLKRQNSNANIDLEIELMSPVDPKTPLQVGMSVETFAPPKEKSVVHSVQRRDVTLSDRNHVIEIKMVMTPDRWEAAKGLCVNFKFESIQHSKPRYSWLWNSNTSKDVEIRFQDPQIPPVLAHKDFILEHCSRFMDLVQVAHSNTNNASDILTLSPASDQQDLTREDGHLASPSTPTSATGPSTPRMTLTSPAARDKKQPIVQETGPLLPLEGRSDISSHYSLGSSFVDVQSPSFYSSKDDLSANGSERDWDLTDVLAIAPGGNSGLSTVTDQQPDVKTLNRRERRALKNSPNAVASGTSSPVDVMSSSTDLDQQEREMEFKQAQETKRRAQQQEREKNLDSPLTHNSSGLKITTASLHPRQQQQQQQPAAASQAHVTSKNGHALLPGREIWYWSHKIHPDICTILLRWLYLEEIPTCAPDGGYGGGVYSFKASEVLLTTFSRLNTPHLFQRFLASQLRCIKQHNDVVSLWNAPELAQHGTMINRFFRPAILETSYENIPKIISSRAFTSIFGPSDPSGIIKDILVRQNPTATRRQ